jgi:carboxymethylenebutenolidase
MLHFGKKDAHIPEEEVEAIHAAHPEVEIYWYDAGHGFNRDVDASYARDAAAEARTRSLNFLNNHLA